MSAVDHLNLIVGWVLVSGAVSHRVWRMAARDAIFEKWREPILHKPGFVADLIDCAWCLGFWLNGAVGLTLLLTGTLGPISAGLVWLAGSTLTGVIGRGD